MNGLIIRMRCMAFNALLRRRRYRLVIPRRRVSEGRGGYSDDVRAGASRMVRSGPFSLPRSAAARSR